MSFLSIDLVFCERPIDDSNGCHVVTLITAAISTHFIVGIKTVREGAK
jgi:hypothetical protein